MKVGIASCYYHHNYGSMLQAYATQRIINEIGCQSITIRCHAPITYMTQSKVTYYLKKLKNIDIIKTKLRQKKSKIQIEKHKDVLSGIKERNMVFDKFSNTMFNLSTMNNNRDDLSQFAASCDAIVVGSDMLWHPVNVEHDYYTLTFVPDEVKKIAYATSFGTTLIPNDMIDTYKSFLCRFDAISVREKSGVELISNLDIDKKGQVVLDPTLLFTGDEWTDIQQPEPIIKDKYILCYFLGVNPMHREFANRIKNITGYKIVALKYLDEFVEYDVSFGDISPYNIGPSELLNLIRNAEYVCTDSFHGTCFSVLNHKKFFTMNRFAELNTQSTNTRIDSLLSLLGLEKRRIKKEIFSDELRELLKEEIDYDSVDDLLKCERDKSIGYLKEALFGRIEK